MSPINLLQNISPAELARREKELRALDDSQVKGCRKCGLCETRTKTVFGEGNPDARLFFIGEGPGRNEDASGRPFVGRAGDLLNKMVAGMGLRREDGSDQIPKVPLVSKEETVEHQDA